MTAALNPDMDMKRILRPASLSITLDNDIIRQLGHTQTHEPHTPGHMMKQYALELDEWAHERSHTDGRTQPRSPHTHQTL